MPIVHDAPAPEVARLLSLFPVAQIKAVWADLPGKKEQLCAAIAGQAESRDQVVNFLDGHLTCCKQHTYVFERPPGNAPAFPATIGAAERLRQVAGGRALYVTRVEFTMFKTEPQFSQESLTFLWPFRLDLLPHHLVVRFVALEKNLASYFDHPIYGVKRDLEESHVMSDILPTYNYPLVDLHAGVKAAWDEDFMDATRVRYKKPHSTASEEMDEERGIKTHNQPLYQALADAMLFQTLFKISPAQNLSVHSVSVRPADGFIQFPRYSDQVGHTDVVVRRILDLN